MQRTNPQSVQSVPSSQSAKVEPAPPSSQVPSMAKLGLPTHALEQMQPGICGAGGACGGTATLKPAIGSRGRASANVVRPNNLERISHQTVLAKKLHVDDSLSFWTGCE